MHRNALLRADPVLYTTAQGIWSVVNWINIKAPLLASGTTRLRLGALLSALRSFRRVTAATTVGVGATPRNVRGRNGNWFLPVTVPWLADVKAKPGPALLPIRRCDESCNSEVMLETSVKPYRRTGGVFKSTKATAGCPKLLAGDGCPRRSTRKDSFSHTSNVPSRSSRGRGEGHKTYKLPSAGIEAAALSKRLFDPAAYIGITGVDELQEPAPTFTPRIGPVNTLQLPTPTGSESLPPSVENSVFSIELPPVNLSREQYLECADAHRAPQDLSIPGQVPDGLADSRGAATATNLDRRQEAYAALDALERLLQSVFAAVGQALGHESGFEHIVTLSTEQEAIMTAATQEKMHDAINKKIFFG
ncbi:hypothetical protein Purlil1_13153 [Purpureocillium lilacinum]|uniref:Uncharacterized protein n=1 Tax=Purpureocillium lilacinum TaxID=33203 RepID=A0ABR0BFI2_PURLI|nr:hypothetical protein Purlil1_13153 [Purpureocillium lilacinum]